MHSPSVDLLTSTTLELHMAVNLSNSSSRIDKPCGGPELTVGRLVAFLKFLHLLAANSFLACKSILKEYAAFCFKSLKSLLQASSRSAMTRNVTSTSNVTVKNGSRPVHVDL